MTDPAALSSSRHRDLAVCAGLVMVCIAIYARTASFGFVSYDDFTYVQTNPHLEHGLTWDGLRWAFGGSYFTDYLPITQLSYLADHSLYGTDPGGYHLTNLLLHIADTLLLYVLLIRMTARTAPAALVALLFAVHPLHVESVAWISSRKDLLCIFFWFVTLNLYVSYARRSSAMLYLAIAVTFTLGLLSKPMILTLPAQLLLLDYWPLARFKQARWGRLIAEKIPLLLVGLAMGALTFYLHRESDVIVVDENLSLSERFQQVAAAYAHYLQKAVWPVGLMPYYPRPNDVSALASVVHVALLIVPTVCAIRWRASSPWVIVGWLWFVGTLAPVSGFVQNADHAAADRYTDVPLVGLYMLLAWSLDAVSTVPVRRRLLAAVALSVCMVLGVRAYMQTGAWRDSETLYSRMLQSDPQNRLALENLAQLRFQDRRFDEALDLIMQAVNVRPGSARLRVQLAATYRALERPEEALAEARLAATLDPENELAHVQRAELTELALGPEAAEEAYADSREQLGFAPKLSTSFAAFLIRHQRIEEAEAALQEVLERRPEFTDALARMGDLRAAQRRYTDAETYYREAVALGADDANVWFNLAQFSLKRGELDHAQAQARAALRLQPDHAGAAQLMQMIAARRMTDREEE